MAERTHSWMNGFGKPRPCTDKRATVVQFYLALDAALNAHRRLIKRARTYYR